jgi:L-rhamnonate dehydratase
MQITDVRACQPIGAGSPPDWRTSLGQILVAVHTDAGLTGYGVGGGGAAGVHVVRTVLRDRLLGRDPQPVESLWEAMYRATLPFGPLWDLRGKAAGLPVAAILGGESGYTTTPIPTYVTVWGDITDEPAAGFRAFKLHIPNHPPDRRIGETVAAVERARKTIGDGARLMIDLWMRWDVPSARAAAHELAALVLDWIEEPLPADDLAGYAELSAGSPVPIAGGEHEFTARGFEPLIAGQLHHVLQPDVCWCGGMTELVKIYRRAASAGLRVCPHRGAEVWGLHAIAALDSRPLAESGRPWMTWVGGQPPIIDGEITLGDATGFGVHFDAGDLP